MQRRGSHRRPPRARWLLALAVIFVAGLLASTRLTGEDDDGGGTAPPATVGLDAYELTYRLDELGRERSERVTVRLPYESHRSSPLEGGRTGTITNEDGLWQLAADPAAGWLLLDPGRRRAEGDTRPLGALVLLAEAGLAERRDDDTALGRRCLAFRVAEPVGSIATKRPTEDDHVDLCVDAATGLVLREQWVADGEVIREQEATSLDLTPSVRRTTFAPTPADPTRLPQNRRELPLTDDILDGLDAAFDLPPSIDDDGGVAILDVDPLGQPVGGTVHRFLRRANEVVDVEEVDAAMRDLDRGIPHDVPIGDGYVETDLKTITLTVVLPSGTAVLLRSHDLALLDEVAATMRISTRSDDVPDG